MRAPLAYRGLRLPRLRCSFLAYVEGPRQSGFEDEGVETDSAFRHLDEQWRSTLRVLLIPKGDA